MYAMRVVLGFSLASALVCGQGTTPIRPARQAPNAAPTTDSTPPKKPGTVEGVVINSMSGRPVKKATIRLGQRSTVSDVAGHFLFENVEPGRYTASVAADGFTPVDEPFTVAEEQRVKNVALKLVPLAVVSGRVLDQDGDPIAGATVQAFRYGYPLSAWRSPKEVQDVGFVLSNDLGEFQIMNLPPARYYFEARALSPQAYITGRSRGVEETYPVTYYPSALDRTHATSVEVTAGAQLSKIDFRVRKIRSYSVRGKVVDRSGQGRLAEVKFGSPGFEANTYAFNNIQVRQDGSFEIRGVSNGSYIVTGQWSEREWLEFARQAINVSGQDLEGVLLVLDPGLEIITGTAQVEESKASPPPGRNLAQSVEKLVYLYLIPQDGIGPGADATMANDGTFVFHHVMPSLYQFSVSRLGRGKYLKSIRFGGRDVSSSQIDLTHQSGGTITLVFGTDGGRIEGSVQGKNGAPAANVAITVAPVEEYEGRRDLFKESDTDHRGNFGIPDIAPGKYKVFAWERHDSMAILQAPEFRKLFESRAATVSVGPNGRESVKLQVISAEDIQAAKSKRP